MECLKPISAVCLFWIAFPRVFLNRPRVIIRLWGPLWASVVIGGGGGHPGAGAGAVDGGAVGKGASQMRAGPGPRGGMVTSSDNGTAPSQPQLARSGEINMVRIRWGAEPLLSGETAMGGGGGELSGWLILPLAAMFPVWISPSPLAGAGVGAGTRHRGSEGAPPDPSVASAGLPSFFLPPPWEGDGRHSAAEGLLCVGVCVIFFVEPRKLDTPCTPYTLFADGQHIFHPFVFVLIALNERGERVNENIFCFSKGTTALSGFDEGPLFRGQIQANR